MGRTRGEGLPAGVAALRVLSRVLRSPWSVLALLLLTLVLGVWGFATLDGGEGWSDDAYRTAQLLYLNASVPEEGTPIQLDIARFLAPLILPYAALVALFAAVGGRAGRMRLALFGRGHVLIVGAGARGTALARALRDHNDVAVFELDEGNGAAASLRRSGVPVLFGDARDEEALRAARPRRASAIVLLAGDDSVNLEILARLRSLLDENRPVPTHVAIDGIILWSELHRLPLEDEDAQRRVEFFSVPDRVARMIARSAFRAGSIPEGGRRILVYGAGEEVPRLVVQLLRSTLVGDGPKFLLEGADAEEALRSLRVTDPWVFERAEVTISGETANVTDSFVCGLPEADALAAAAEIQRRIPGASPVHVSVPDPATEESLREVGVDLDRYVLIPTGSGVISEDLLRASAFELIARGRHEEYLRGEDDRGAEPTGSTAPWDELDEQHRIANYRYADGVYRMLDDVGACLVPVEVGGAPQEMRLSPVAVQYLAIREHNRWWADKCRDGFRWGPEQIPGGNVHPSMVPWDWLSEEDKDRDAESVRVLPKLLAEVGYGVELPDPADVDARIAAAGGVDAAKAWRPSGPGCAPPPDAVRPRA